MGFDSKRRRTAKWTWCGPRAMRQLFKLVPAFGKMGDTGSAYLTALLVNKGAGIIQLLRRRLYRSQQSLRVPGFPGYGRLRLRTEGDETGDSNNKFKQGQCSPHKDYLPDSFANVAERAY